MAMASDNPNVSLQVMEDDLSCNICYNLLREPKDLDCPHVFCLQCLQKWTRKQPTVECPECRYITVVPRGGVVNLKTNFRLKSVVENYAERTEKQKGVPICPNHEGEKQHFFCVTCGVTVCHNCLVLEHERPHHEIQDLKFSAKNKKVEVKAKMGRVKQKMKEGEDAEKKLDEMEHKLTVAKNQAEAAIEKRRQEVISEAEANAKKMTAAIEATYQERLKSLKEKRQHARDRATRLRNVHTVTENVVNTAADHVFIKQHLSLIDKMNKLCVTDQEMPSPDLTMLQFNPGSGSVNSSWFGEVVSGGYGKCELKLDQEFGAFTQVQGVAVTQSGLLAIVDALACECIIYRNVNGEYKRQFSLGSSCDKPAGKITKPYQVAVTPEGKFLVTHQGDVIKIFSSSGRYENTLTGVGDRITTTPDGMIVTGHSVTGVITVHHSHGELIRKHHVDYKGWKT